MVGRQRRERISAARWSAAAAAVWTGMADWRAAPPRATFGEIEAALDERVSRVRARALERRPTPEPSGPTVLQVGADGAPTSLARTQWAEVKAVAIGTVVREPGGGVRAREPPYFSRRAARRSTPSPAPVADPTPSPPAPPPGPETILDGRPTKAHPWNRRFLRHRPASPAES